MKTLEEFLNGRADANQFWEDCRSAFGSGAGSRVLRVLSEFRQPYSSAFQNRTEADPNVTAFIDGQKDVISTLARFALAPGGSGAGDFNPYSVEKSDGPPQ